MAPIHAAAQKCNVAALRRELEAGVSPDLLNADGCRPLYEAIVFGSAVRPPESIRQRLACIEALLDAGASVNATSDGGITALQTAVGQTDRSKYPADFELIVDRLLRAGADVNAINARRTSVLAEAAYDGRSTVIAKLLSAGAVDPRGFDEPLRRALICPRPRNCALLMRAGAVLKLDNPELNGWLEQSHYLRKVNETPGGFTAYEKAHRQRLTAIFLAKSKFQSLPAEMVSHIVSFGFHCGFY